MNSRSRGFLVRVFMLTLVAFLALPASAFAQRNQRREDRRERRDERREERQERRAERRGRNWERYGNYGGSANLRQTALNAGFNNGIEEGRKDLSRRERYDFRDEKDYQKATEDYSSKLGSKELYKRYFREGFENGYEAGYNGY